MDELTFLSATQMAEQIRQKKISPVEVVRAHLGRIEKLNPRLNAIVSLDRRRAWTEAQAAEAAVMRSDSVGPLHGVPITIKSSIDVAGLRAECGSKLRAGYVATTDAPLVGRLRRAGAIILGTTNVPEMLMSYETDNLLYGRTNNPWALDRTPGGSSGGEAAAIAAGCSAGGVGSDGGGSIRVPAHFSGICGLKPTPGRIPASGHFPASVGPFAHLGVVGPMARTVGDLEILLRVMAGPDIGDTSAAPVAFRRPSEEETRRIHIGYFEDDGRTQVTLETRAAVRQAAEALKHQGFEVAAYRPDGLEGARQAWWVLFGLAGGMLFQPIVAGREAELGPILRELMGVVRAEPPLTAERLLHTLIERDVLREQLLRQMNEFPVLLCPVAAGPAFRHREIGWSKDGRIASYLETMSYSQWFNLLGNPAATVPVGRSTEGLPIGVQVVGRPWEEENVLAIANQIERGCGGWKRPPLDD
ncbi:MAG TPA: amidase [Candidatus Acidoferrales bacterium]|nr:amidase [Candidatus Acidoferrales bacterium]